MSVAEKSPRLVKPGKGTPARATKPARRSVVIDFQTDAIALEERRPPFTARLTLYLVAAAICCGVGWASIAEIDEIVVAPGKLATSEPTLVMQPLETSIIRAIAVKPGDIVRKGQLLATLDPTFTSSDAGQLKSRIAGYQAQSGRLQAELDNKPYSVREDASPEEVMQAQLYEQRQLAFAARLADFDAQIARSQAAIDAAGAQQAAINKRLDGLSQIEEMRASLAESGNGSQLSLLESRDLSLELRVSLSQIEGLRAEAVEQRKQTLAERQNFVEDYRRLALEALVDLEYKNAEAVEESRKAALRTEMSQLFAPADAAVLEVAERSVSSVIQPAEPLLTLVPINVPLEVEVMVASSDIGHLAVGDVARVKFDAFPFQTHGTIAGTVKTISGNAFPEQNPAGAAREVSHYRVTIDLGDGRLHDLPEGFVFLPGMTVSAEIHAGERTVLSYFLHPLIRGLDEALHEP